MQRSLVGRRTMAATLAALIAVATLAIAPATAVTNGRPDGNGHPYVGLMAAKDASGEYLWRCSGALLTSTIFLTAGHCVAPDGDEVPARVDIWFDPGPIDRDPNFVHVILDGDGCADPAVSGWPCFGADVSGTPYPHPDYDERAFFLRDLGVVVVDQPIQLNEYASLPQLDSLDALKPGRRTTFTAVGYGLQRAFPAPASFLDEALLERRFSTPHLLQVNVPGFVGDFALLLSNNANSGGTCYGDSGGPNFLGDSNVVAGVTSFGLNWTCGGTGGVFRVDRSWSLDWLADEFGVTP